MDDISTNKVIVGAVVNMHKLLGLAILALMILRLIWALTNAKPVLPIDVPLWQRWAERIVHGLLYLLLLAMPLVGWIGSVAGGRPPHYGMLSLGLPIEKSKPLAGAAFDIHNTMAIVILVIVSMHVLAALYHRFMRKDDILNRMLPNG